MELEDTFDGKINEGEEYVGQNEIRFKRRAYKRADHSTISGSVGGEIID